MLEMMQTIFGHFADALKKVLPMSPFAPFISEFRNLPYMGYLNWFIPVGDCMKVMSAWLTAIALFYVYSIVLRWIKAIS